MRCYSQSTMLRWCFVVLVLHAWIVHGEEVRVAECGLVMLVIFSAIPLCTAINVFSCIGWCSIQLQSFVRLYKERIYNCLLWIVQR